MSELGHEEEFRRLFEEEARVRLAQLSEQAMELETRGDDPELIAAMFRHAHTIKGGAGVVGFTEIADVVHELESAIEDIRAGNLAPSAATADAILAVVDALTDMVPRSVAGEDQLGARLMARAALDRLGPLTQRAADAPEPGGGLVVFGAGDLARPATDSPAGSIPVPVARLDELVRLVGEGAAAQLRVGRAIAERLGDEPAVLDDYRDLARVLGSLQEQAMRARMVTLATVAGPLRRAARDLARAAGKQIRWELGGEETELDRHVLEHLREPLVALVRNAVDHGIEPEDERRAAGKDAAGEIRIHAMQIGAEVVISVADDGRGIDFERVRGAAGPMSDEEAMEAIFRPGVSTAPELTGVSGRGIGLDVVRQAIDDLRGRIEVHSDVGHGTEFRISVPMTLAVLRCLIIGAGGSEYALPLRSAAVLLPAGTEEMSAEGRPAVWVGGDAVGLSDLGAVLGAGTPAAKGPVVVVSALAGRHAFRVDALKGQRDVVVKELGRVLPRLDLLAGASVELDGSVLLVLDPGGLLHGAAAAAQLTEGTGPPAAQEPVRPVVLVVDDAQTIRELERTILERAGYDVVTAVDGEAAWARLAAGGIDLVLTDIEMPGLDGIALTRRIRATAAMRHLPVLVLTTRAGEEDHRRGLEAGADGYLVKSAFDEHGLLTAVRRLLREPSRRGPSA